MVDIGCLLVTPVCYPGAFARAADRSPTDAAQPARETSVSPPTVALAPGAGRIAIIATTRVSRSGAHLREPGAAASVSCSALSATYPVVATKPDTGQAPVPRRRW